MNKHVCFLGGKYIIKIPMNSVDKPFDTCRDPITGEEKLSYMNNYDTFDEADKAADDCFKRNGYTEEECSNKDWHIFVIDREIGSLLQVRDLATAIVNNCDLVQYVARKNPVEEPVYDKDDGVLVNKRVTRYKVFSCLVKKEEKLCISSVIFIQTRIGFVPLPYTS